jgi:2-haloacid dehalogenase
LACNIYAFDAYGTLFDVHAAVRRHASAVGPDAARLSEIWRNKQLEYTWVRTLAGRYLDFWALTEQALDFAFASVPSADHSARSALLDAYRSLDCYAEVPGVIRALKDNGRRVAILSNGSPTMLMDAVSAAGLADSFDAVLSVDPLGAYKTDPRVYDLVTAHFGVSPEAVSFQSSNRWDIAGATAYGMRAVWINRTDAPDEYPDLPPSAVLSSLEGLIGLQ